LRWWQAIIEREEIPSHRAPPSYFGKEYPLDRIGCVRFLTQQGKIGVRSGKACATIQCRAIA
jgi:hypothetical protein